jgi:hypothetical protein
MPKATAAPIPTTQPSAGAMPVSPADSTVA